MVREAATVDVDAGAKAVLAGVASAVFRRPPRRALAAGGFDFLVDGTRIEATVSGPRTVRLLCGLPPQAREAELRALMAQYLRYCDAGADVLCADAAGRVLLIAEIAAGDDLAASVAAFCDAAVHWQKTAARRSENLRPAPGPVMIFP